MAGWHHRCNGHELGQALGDVEGQGGLACCVPWDCKELEVTGWLNNNSDPGCCFDNPATKWLLDSLFQYFFIHSTCIEHQLHSKLFKKKVIFSFLPVLGLHCCRQAFSSCGKQGVLCCRAWALGCTCGTQGLVALWHMEWSRSRDQTCVSCIGRQILIQWTPREVPLYSSFDLSFENQGRIRPCSALPFT